ncbi:MAG: hypothetical protein V8S87_01185 [Oscillospiraceae bacterium]
MTSADVKMARRRISESSTSRMPRTIYESAPMTAPRERYFVVSVAMAVAIARRLQEISAAKAETIRHIFAWLPLKSS